MIWQSGHRNNAEGEDVISARPFVVLADIFILLFVLFLVMPFFMYFKAQRAIEWAAMQELKKMINPRKQGDGIPYEQISRGLLSDAVKNIVKRRELNGQKKKFIANQLLPESSVLVEKYRSGDLIRFRVQGTKPNQNPFNDSDAWFEARDRVTELAKLVRLFASGPRMSLTSKFESLDDFLRAYDLNLDRYPYLDSDSKAILWRDHIRQADRRGVIKRITIQGHRDSTEPDDIDIARAKLVAKVFQQAGGNPFEPDEVEVSVVSNPIYETANPRSGVFFPNQYVDIILVFNQDYSVLFKDKLENMDR